MSTVCFKVDSIENGAVTFSVYNYPINPTLELTTTTAAGSSTSSVDMSCLADMIDEKTVPIYQGATASAAGVAGTVPPATSAEKDMFLKGDGTWSSIPQPDLSNYATKDVATTSTNGLMSSTDKTKLDGLSQYPRITQLRRSGENTNTLANGGYNTGNTSVRYELSLSKPISFGMNRTKTIQTGISKLSGSSYDYDYYTYAVEVVAANFSGDGITVNNNIMSVPEYEGATASAAGTDGLVPAATSAEKDMFLKGDGTWEALPTNHVTTDTDQDITGTKTFVGQKKIAFKQSVAADKLGFTLFDRSNNEVGYLEYNPSNSGKVNGVPVMTLGNYATKAAERSYVGFRRYSSISGAAGAYNLLTPLIVDARTPFNLTTTYTNFYLLLGVSDGTTMYTVGSNGVLDLSAMIPTGVAHLAGAETFTGSKTFGAGVYGNVVAMSAGAIDVSAGTVFTKTITANTTISFTNVPAAPATACVTLILTNGGAYTVTWPSSVKWSGGTAPDLTASGVDVLTFLTIDGGTTWYGTVNSLGAA